ncbi:MAG: exopolysaccharide biosynthesis protein [Alphaproteobacteria bacterium]|nr:MAG: exopolysaccharide biosynthesis protein [Alphaproteobacteria bacterium]
MNPLNPPSLANDNYRKSVSTLLENFGASHQESKVTIGHLVDALGSRGYGLLILVLDLPNLIPLPLPGLSTIFGVPMALISLQLLLGLKRPWLPKSVMERGIDKENFQKLFSKARPIIEKVERILRPRLMGLTHPYMKPAVGLAILVMAATMSLPIPLGNLVLAIPIALIALGMIEKDGLFVLLGMIVGAMALAFNATVVLLGVEGIMKVYNNLL